MRVYIRNMVSDLHPSVNNAVAFEGFKTMGAEVIFYDKIEEIEGHQPHEIVVGHIGDVKMALHRLGKNIPPEINYPEELQPFLGRKIWTSTINTIANHPENWNIFVKPLHASKKFTGVVVKSTADLIGCGDPLQDTEVLCSEIVNFVTEWRCFVRYGQLLDARRYKGDWKQKFDYQIIEKAIATYNSAPAGYGIDFGLTDKGETLLIEVNDGYALGSYGLFPTLYAKMLSARWAEMTGTEDFYDF